MHDFGATRELWNAYVTAFSHHWSHGNDPRMLLVAEAGERVDQLAELVLLLEPELRTLRGDPAANRQNREEWLKLYSRYAQGTLSDEEYRARLARL
ncbi:MAG: SHOCT domain-containing protein, partial [Gemmatimonadetes bacterium]|nr:SHOCT domain-containing protein [Gemmatimonadota bacterium]